MIYPLWLKGVLLAGFVSAVAGFILTLIWPCELVTALFPAGLIAIGFVRLWARRYDRATTPAGAEERGDD